VGSKDSTSADSIQKSSSIDFQTSSYDDSATDRETLKQLSDQKVFSVVDARLAQTLSERHQEYFKAKPEYELLSYAKGDLFQEGKEDYAFVVYDKKNIRISILLYNAMANKYSELFRDIKVVNGLVTADCNYGAAGTLDYQLGETIVYQERDLRKRPEMYLESIPCKITDLSKDSDFVLESGCFSKTFPKTNLANSLCISTDSVYNNWECLKYDKASNAFVIYYGQAFAD